VLRSQSIAYRLLNGEKLNITKAGNYTIINYDNDYLIIDTATRDSEGCQYL